MSELDNIINDGKVNTSTAMVVFAIEIKALQLSVEELKRALKDDNDRYISNKDFEVYRRKVDNLYAFFWKLLSSVLIALIIGTVVYTKAHP